MVDMGYRFRIYPNRRQRLLIERTFGCTRWVWNHFLNKRQVEYEETGRSSRAFRQMKDLPKLKDANPWLREVDSVSLQAVIQHLDRAYDNFYRRVTSKKKGGYKGTTGYPRFKGKHNRHQSYTTKNVGHTVYVADDKHVRLPKLGMVKTRVSRPVTGVVKSATVSRQRRCDRHRPRTEGLLHHVGGGETSQPPISQAEREATASRKTETVPKTKGRQQP